MKRLLSDNPKKVYESKNKILNSVRFVDDNTDCSNRFKEEFQIYKKRRIIDYLTYPIKGYNTQDLIDSIIENMGISKDSFAELIKNTKSNIPIFDCLERFLGFFITCRIYKALFGFRKRVNV